MHGSITKAAAWLAFGMIGSTMILVTGAFVTIIGMQFIGNGGPPNCVPSNQTVPTYAPSAYVPPAPIQMYPPPITPVGAPIGYPVNMTPVPSVPAPHCPIGEEPPQVKPVN